MKGYKGFEKGLICKGKQYAENTVFEEETAEICESGMRFCELPHQVFEHYSPGENHEFAEVEALDEVHTDNNRKYCTKKLRIGTKISVFDICKLSVSAAFERFGFWDKVKNAETNDARDYGAANAGNYGAANAGNRGAANAGDFGAANAGNCGAANAGDYGAANAGNCGAANAGNRGAANAGYYGAANAGDCGAAIVRKQGTASIGKNGVAIAFGRGAKAKGKIGSVLVLIDTDENGNILSERTLIVDGEKIKEDTYYTIKNNRLAKAE